MGQALLEFRATLADIPAVGQLVDPGARLFLPYLASALVLAAVVYGRAKVADGPRSIRGFLRFVFPRAIYLSRSTVHDAALFAFNASLRAVLLPSAPVLTAGVAAVVLAVVRRSDAAPFSGAPSVVVVVLYAVALFLASDATRFLLHLALHRVPTLWAIHKVHHCAEVMTPLTLHRVHPVESLLFALRAGLSTGVTTALFLWAFGERLSLPSVLGVNLFGFVFNLAGANLRHSHIWLSYGPRIERHLLSPAQHQVHHSSDPRHFDKNLGSFLAIWDRLAGSLYVPAPGERVAFGLDEEARPPRASFAGLLIDPLRQMFGADR